MWVAPGWQIEGIGNYDGDATADILWRHVNGAVVSTELDGINALIGNASSDWYIPSQGSGASMAGAAAGGLAGAAANGGELLGQGNVDDSPGEHGHHDHIEGHDFPAWIGNAKSHSGVALEGPRDRMFDYLVI